MPDVASVSRACPSRTGRFSRERTRSSQGIVRRLYSDAQVTRQPRVAPPCQCTVYRLDDPILMLCVVSFRARCVVSPIDLSLVQRLSQRRARESCPSRGVGSTTWYSSSTSKAWLPRSSFDQPTRSFTHPPTHSPVAKQPQPSGAPPARGNLSL